MTEYPITPELQEEIDNRMTYHAPTGDQPERYQAIRSGAKELMELAARLVPPSPERGEAFKKLEGFCFWANAGIARRE
ncbi:hypothetical protein F4Z99_18635 [Candidatus Poribacteria bacterium]|nr:hypothetical protein [Candidatus Poribacteria bacterium]MYB01146.1 hypothetical protein [Candidatus Poribacteria bacterium]